MKLTEEELNKRKKEVNGMLAFFSLGSPDANKPSDMQMACDKYLSGEIDEKGFDDALEQIRQNIVNKYK